MFSGTSLISSSKVNVEVEGHSCSVYRIGESGRKGMDEDEIVDKLSQRVSRDINIGVVPVLVVVRYSYDPRTNEYRCLERAMKVITHIFKSPRFIRLSTLRLVVVISRNVLSKNVAQPLLEMLDKDSIEYAT